MYRTATIAVYDVMDQIHISARVTEYPETPGTFPPSILTMSSQVRGRGEEDWSQWLLRALSDFLADNM